MFRLIAPVLVFLTLLFQVAQLSGCASGTVNENDPAAMYKDAEEEVKTDHYQLAIDKLRVIKNKFPYSSYAVEAQLKIADVYFLQESFAEAAGAYESFRDLHPKHEKVAYAMFRIAKSHFNDIPSTIQRDMTPAQKALEAYKEFLGKFPSAKEAPEANKDVAEIRRQLAEKELSVGDFYYKRDFYESARPRYKKVVELFPETNAARVAQEKLVVIASKLKEPEANAKP